MHPVAVMPRGSGAEGLGRPAPAVHRLRRSVERSREGTLGHRAEDRRHGIGARRQPIRGMVCAVRKRAIRVTHVRAGTCNPRRPAAVQGQVSRAGCPSTGWTGIADAGRGLLLERRRSSPSWWAAPRPRSSPSPTGWSTAPRAAGSSCAASTAPAPCGRTPPATCWPRSPPWSGTRRRRCGPAARPWPTPRRTAA